MLDVLGLLIFVALVLLAYFRLPPVALEVSNTWQAAALGLAALAVLGWLYWGSLRRVETSRRPLLRAVRLVVALVTLVVVAFAYAYLSLQARYPGQVPGLITHLDALYFTVTMLTTVGFGDIAPAGQQARAVATANMVVNLVVLGVLVQTAVKVGRQAAARRLAARQGPSGGGG